MQTATLILLLQTVSTWFMVGLIWFVQIVQYPLLRHVGEHSFRTYQDQNRKRTAKVVALPMFVEAITSLPLVWYLPVTNKPLGLLAISLLFIVWMSTMFLQMPCHAELAPGFDRKAHRQLVLTNWLRTVCWTLRGILLVWFLFCFVADANN